MAAPPPLPSSSSSQQSTQPESSPVNSTSNLSWDGDKMFNIYIYDYCSKRGYRRTAKELMDEAGLPMDALPPIDARQGLLFEWWSVFWLLFQAKSNGGGSEEGLLYIQHQQRMNQRPPHPLPGSLGGPPGQMHSVGLPLGNPPLQPGQLHPQQQTTPGSGVGQTQQQPIGRLPNGLPSGSGMPPGMNRPPSAYSSNGAMPNGVGIPPQQQQGNASGPQQLGFGGVGANGGPPPQVNGVQSGIPQQPQQGQAGQGQGPPGQGGQPPPYMQRMMNGIPPQQRGGPNGGGPFHSPTMAPSPGQQPGGAGGAPGQPAPMAQLGPGPIAGPSPHMQPMSINRGSMPPPMMNGGPPQQGQPGQQSQPQTPGGPPTPGYPIQNQNPNGGPGQPQQGGRPPSRTNTPRNSMMTHPSPSLAARQTPVNAGPGQNPGQGPMVGVISGMGGMGTPVGNPNSNVPNSGNGGAPGHSTENSVNAEILQIQTTSLNVLKNELGLGEKDLGQLNMQEKNQILSLWRSRANNMAQNKPGMIQQPHSHNQQPQQRPGTVGPTGAVQRIKRSSTSPGEEHESLPRNNESSPPATKRARKSPAEGPSTLGGPYGHHPGQPGPQQQSGHPGGPHMQQQPGQGPPGQPMNPGQMAQAQQQHHMNVNAMMLIHRQQQQQQQIPMAGMPMPGGPPQQHPQPGPPMVMSAGGVHSAPMVNPQQQQQQQQQMQQMYRPQKGNMGPNAQVGGGVGPDHPFNPGMTSQFNSSPLNRMVQGKPMMPPPSPAMNGPPKEIKQEAVQGKLSGPSNNGGPPRQMMQHNPDGSPQGLPPPTAGSGGPGGGPSGNNTAPPTPVPGNQPNPLQQQQQGQQSQGQPQPSQQPQAPNPNPMGTNSMNSLLGMPTTGMNPSDLSMFDSFPMEDFDGTGLFPSSAGDINFERDFGQWFNPDDVGSLDFKT